MDKMDGKIVNKEVSQCGIKVSLLTDLAGDKQGKLFISFVQTAGNSIGHLVFSDYPIETIDTASMYADEGPESYITRLQPKELDDIAEAITSISNYLKTKKEAEE